MPQLLKDAYKEVLLIQVTCLKCTRKIKREWLSLRIGKKKIFIDAPALIIIGDNDVVSPEHAVEIFRSLPHARLSILPDIYWRSNHWDGAY